MPVETHTCPSCGASVPFPAGVKRTACPYCNSVVSLAEGAAPADPPPAKPFQLPDPPRLPPDPPVAPERLAPPPPPPPADRPEKLPDWLEPPAISLPPAPPPRSGSTSRTWIGCAAGCGTLVVLEALCLFAGLVVSAMISPTSSTGDWNPVTWVMLLFGGFAAVVALVVFLLVARLGKK